MTTIFGRSFTTTGVLGASRDESGQLAERGFPSWLTIPSYQDLATGRRWHFFFAWLLVLNGALYVPAMRTFLRVAILKGFPALGRGIAIDPDLDLATCALALSQGRRGAALQRAAETRLSLRYHRAAGPGVGRPDNVARRSTRHSPGCSALFGGTPIWRARSILSRPSISSDLSSFISSWCSSRSFLNNMVSMITGRYAIEEDRHGA